jgi:hypothetical protein
MNLTVHKVAFFLSYWEFEAFSITSGGSTSTIWHTVLFLLSFQCYTDNDGKSDGNVLTSKNMSSNMSFTWEFDGFLHKFKYLAITLKSNETYDNDRNTENFGNIGK